MGGTIFISYRRGTDSPFTRLLYDRLESVFGRERVFIDVNSIAPSEDFVAVLEAYVAECDVLLALIGSDWLTATDEAGQTQQQERRETEEAKKPSAGKSINPYPPAWCHRGDPTFRMADERKGR